MNQQVFENDNGGRVRIYIIVDTGEAIIPTPAIIRALDDGIALIRHAFGETVESQGDVTLSAKP